MNAIVPIYLIITSMLQSFRYDEAVADELALDYLDKAGLSEYLDQLGFNLVGYGCTTCIGNSGPLPDNISEAVKDNNLYAVSVLSGNRNFEGRISPHIKANNEARPLLDAIRPGARLCKLALRSALYRQGDRRVVVPSVDEAGRVEGV